MLGQVKQVWEAVVTQVFDKAGLEAIFTHARNVLTGAAVVAAGLYAVKHVGNERLGGLLSVHMAGHIVAFVGIALLALNLADGLRKLARKRHQHADRRVPRHDLAQGLRIPDRDGRPMAHEPPRAGRLIAAEEPVLIWPTARCSTSCGAAAARWSARAAVRFPANMRSAMTLVRSRLLRAGSSDNSFRAVAAGLTSRAVLRRSSSRSRRPASCSGLAISCTCRPSSSATLCRCVEGAAAFVVPGARRAGARAACRRAPASTRSSRSCCADSLPRAAPSCTCRRRCSRSGGSCRA